MKITYHEVNGSQSDGYYFKIVDGKKVVFTSRVYDSCWQRDDAARDKKAQMERVPSSSKISKKNMDRAYLLVGYNHKIASVEEVATELQKRDDKIKALRAEAKERDAEIRELKEATKRLSDEVMDLRFFEDEGP